MELTITEALAEIKTIGKRVEKKRQFIGSYLARQEHRKDPLAKEGGSFQRIEQERQSIDDLQKRSVALRLAIQAANNENTITIDGDTRSISEWLTWRREIAPGQAQWLGGLVKNLQGIREDASRKGLAVVSDASAVQSDDDVIVNISEDSLHRDVEHLEEVTGTLDGQLSLKNATVLVTV